MKTPKNIANELLQPLVDFCRQNRGTIKELAEELSKRIGKKVHRQVLETWLHEDPAKRMTPNLGLGLILFDEGQKIMKQPRTIDVAKLIRKA